MRKNEDTGYVFTTTVHAFAPHGMRSFGKSAHGRQFEIVQPSKHSLSGTSGLEGIRSELSEIRRRAGRNDHADADKIRGQAVCIP